jgi:Ca-activated chloride channel family protein
MVNILQSLVLVSFFIQVGSGQSALRENVQQGNEHYNIEEYDDALNSYQAALLEDQQSAIAHYNQGNALYKLEKYDEAIESYQKALGAKEIEMESLAYFNIGNAFFKQDKLQESIGAYIKSLERNPGDQDAKYNLELARAKLKESADKQQSQQQDQQNIEPSEYAKKLLEQAKQLVEQRKYEQAHQLMIEGEKRDRTVAAFRAFTTRIKDIVDMQNL